MTFDRTKLVNMASLSVGKDSRVMIIFEIPASVEGFGSAVEMLDEIRKTLPPGVDHDGNWAINARHAAGCESSETRDMDDCSCHTLVCECFQIDAKDEALLRSTGGYDLEIGMGDGPTQMNRDRHTASSLDKRKVGVYRCSPRRKKRGGCGPLLRPG